MYRSIGIRRLSVVVDGTGQRPTGKNQILSKTGVIRWGAKRAEFGNRLSRGGMTRLGDPFDFSMWPHGPIKPLHATTNPDLHLFGHMSKLLDPIELLSFQDLLDAGAHHGHKVHMMHPKMSSFIFGVRKGFHVIDLYHTLASVRTVARLAQYLVLNGGKMLWVCYDEKFKPMTDYYANLAQQPYMIDRWRPGFFTNFDEVFFNSRNAKALQPVPMKALQWSEQRKAARKQYAVNAYSSLEGPPSMVFFVNMKKSKYQVYEANQMQIPCIGLLDTDQDPSGLDYPIAVNDENHMAVGAVLKTIALCTKDAMDYRTKMRENNGLLFDQFPSLNVDIQPPSM